MEMVQISSIHQSDFKYFTVDLNSVIYCQAPGPGLDQPGP